MTKKRSHFSVVREPEAELELAVLNLEDLGARCRRLDDGAIVIYRGKDQLEAVPGTIATVKVKKRGESSGQPVVWGRLTGRRIDVARFGAPPLALDPRAARDLDRKAFSFERGVARLPTGDDPVELLASVEGEEGAPDRWAMAMVLLKLDERTVEAHAALGDLLFADRPQDARLHFEVGASLGEYALGPGFQGCVPWRFYENQAFLHCLRELGVCEVRLGRVDSARAAFERALALDPDDGQGVGKMLRALAGGEPPGLEDDDAEDAEDEDADGDWPPPPVREGVPPVDLSAFVTAFETNVPGFDWFIDLQTGDVIQAQEGDDELLPVPLDEMRESDRFVLVEPDGSHEGFEDMQDFALDCPDERLREKLLRALEGKGPFRRFKDALLDHPAARAQFFAFKDEQVAARARRWLEDEGIPYVEKKPAKA